MLFLHKALAEIYKSQAGQEDEDDQEKKKNVVHKPLEYGEISIRRITFAMSILCQELCSRHQEIIKICWVDCLHSSISFALPSKIKKDKG
jgi:hypothetical protein